MAENETLDLRKHARWNRARRLLSDGAQAEDISIEIRRCIEKTFARLHRLMPLRDLIAAVRSPWGSPGLLLAECKDAAEFFEMIIQIGRSHSEPEALFFELSKHLVDAGRIDAQERTQRCRAFLFIAAGVVSAISRGASKVLMFESGVGAVNTPMMAGMATGGRTTRGSHPYVLERMSELASLIARRRVDVELPYWQSTKAELVRNLADNAATGTLEGLARDTVSCVHYPRRTVHRQCGVCPACIGRRQAMLSAGIDEGSEEYEHDIFAGQGKSAPPPEKLEYLKAMIAQVHDFGAIGDDLALPEFLKRWLLGTGIAVSKDGARPWLDVLQRYRAEWLRLAEIHHDCAVPWPAWLVPSVHEQKPYASGF